MIFWERFYQMCVLRGTKPNPLAKELGISSGAVTRWKNAEDPPSGKTLMLLADRLDCSVDYLLGRTDDPRSSSVGFVVLVGYITRARA